MKRCGITLDVSSLSTTGIIVLRDLIQTECNRTPDKKIQLRLLLQLTTVKVYLNGSRGIE